MSDTPRKYEFTGQTKEHLGLTLHQIRAVVSFGSVAAGAVGGWIEDEGNLTHEGDAWVYGNAWVSGNAQVSGNARVYGNARVCNIARVYGNARVCGDALVCGNAWVCGDALVSRTPKCLTGFEHIVTVTDHHVAAGCQMHPPSVWRDRGVEIISAAGFSDEAKPWAAIINAIAEAHGCVDAPADAEVEV